MTEITQPWEQSADHLLTALATNSKEGISQAEAVARVAKYGPNELETRQMTTAFDVLVRQFKSLIVLLLAAAAIVAFAFGEIIDGSAILVVILLNTAIGFFHGNQGGPFYGSAYGDERGIRQGTPGWAAR